MTPGAEYRMSPQGIRNQGSAAGARRLVRSIVAYLRLAKLGALPCSWTVVVVDPMLLIADHGTFSMP